MFNSKRLQEVLGTPALSPLIDRLASRLRRGKPLVGKLIIKNPTDAERDAIQSLLGRPPSSGLVVHVDLDRLAEMVRNAELAVDLSDAVVRLRGPIANEREALRQREQAWREMWDEAILTLGDHAKLIECLNTLRRDGTLRRFVLGDHYKGRSLLRDVIGVLLRLPHPGILLAELSAQTCGDSHALDRGQPVATLVLRCLSCLSGRDLPLSASERRNLWEAFGVASDELSGPVLVLNLRAHGEGPLACALNLHADSGEPYRISTRQLLREDATTTFVNREVYVCENPSVVSAAVRKFGYRSAGLICVEGHPRIAAHLLLSRLAACGVQLYYHGDFDWPGIAIANAIRRKYGAIPWRMNCADYERAALVGLPLRGTLVTPEWDHPLAQAMKRYGRAVHEEAVVDALLSDLCPYSMNDDNWSRGNSESDSVDPDQ